jgi:succinate dehydrogenase hydrophobic anchor subunit
MGDYMSSVTSTRSPAMVGYGPWVIHRLTAVLLVALLTIYISVQVFGVILFYRLSIYQYLPDLILIAVFTHRFLAVRTILLGTNWSSHNKIIAICAFGTVFVAVASLRKII